MDRRLKTTAVTLASAFALVAGVPALAQKNVNGYDQSQPAPSENNSELPKGLTFVPWKIGRRDTDKNGKTNSQERSVELKAEAPANNGRR